MTTEYRLAGKITVVIGFSNSNFYWYFLSISFASFENILKVYLSVGDGVKKFAIGVICVKVTLVLSGQYAGVFLQATKVSKVSSARK